MAPETFAPFSIVKAIECCVAGYISVFASAYIGSRYRQPCAKAAWPFSELALRVVPKLSGTASIRGSYTSLVRFSGYLVVMFVPPVRRCLQCSFPDVDAAASQLQRDAIVGLSLIHI